MMSITKTRTLVFLFVVVLIANLYVWQVLAMNTPGVLRVSFLDVGQGDAIYIQAPNGVEMLIDGGRDRNVLEDLGGLMKLGDSEIDVLLATHPDADHIGGLPDVLERFKVSKIIWNGVTGSTGVFREYEEDMKAENAEIVVGKQGTKVMLDSERNIYFEILYPFADTKPSSDTNSYSIIGRLVYGEREFLLTGDAGVTEELALVKWCTVCLMSDILKAGHHGSRTSSAKSFVTAVDPEYVVVSAGADNSYGHPHKEVVSLFTQAKIPILETSKEGTITFETDGVGLWRR